MTDNELFRLLIPVIHDGLHSFGIDDIVIDTRDDATQPGTPSGNTLYLRKIGDVRYGFPQRKSVWDRAAGVFIHSESVWMQSTFRVKASIPADPERPDLPTASDVLNLTACVLQGDAARQVLQSHGVGIYRIPNTLQMHSDDDRDRSGPSFDFTLTHLCTMTSQAPSVDTFEQSIHLV